MNYDNQKEWDHVETFLKRTSTSQLLRLYLEGLPLSVESVEEILRISPHVEDLRLDGRMFDSYIVSRLTWIPGDEDSNLLPKLKFFIIVGCSTTYVSVEELVHMVYSRARYTFLIPNGEDNGWVGQLQSEQWNEDNGPNDIAMIYLANTTDMYDVDGCSQMQDELSSNPILKWFMDETSFRVVVDSL